MQQPMNGYYDVMIRNSGEANRYRVFAASDYAAAVQVRKATGFMAQSEEDVIFISAYDSRFLLAAEMLRA